MKTISTVRHAATGNAAKRIISGRLDEPLSEQGRQAAVELVTRLGYLQAELVVSSPLSRSLETATIMTGLEQERIERWDDCLERSYGRLEGLSPADVKPLQSSIRYIRAGGIDHSVDPPGGEHLVDLRERARGLAARLLARPESTILVFAHQTILQQLHGVLLGHSLEQALTIDVRILQVDEFTVRDGRSTAHRKIYSGDTGFSSW